MKIIKAYGSVFITALLFFLMIDTKYHPALGDPIVSFFGIHAWIIEDGMSTHISVFIFGFLFIVSLFLLEKYRKEFFTGMKTFVVFFLMVTLLYTSTSFIATSIKGNQEGLMAVGFLSDDSSFSYKYENENITEFSFELTLKNYSKDAQTFTITLENTFQYEDKSFPMTILDDHYEPVLFTLEPGQEHTFELTSQDYKVSSSSLSYAGSGGGGSGDLTSIILSNNLQSVRQHNRFLFGEVLRQNPILD